MSSIDRYELEKFRIKKSLSLGGHDGLCNDKCGCSIDDLAPCDDIQNDCRPGIFTITQADTLLLHQINTR